MTAFGKRLVQAAKEARAIARGEADPSTYRVHTPAEIDVKAIRASQKVAQADGRLIGPKDRPHRDG